jgi:alpha-1,2-mannosyltransferase
MKVVILHNSLNILGGGERLCLVTIEALKERGHQVALGTVDRTDWNRVTRFFGRVTRPDGEMFLPFRRFPYFAIYQRMLILLHAFRKYRWADVIFNTHGDMLPFNFPARRLVTYVHFPTFTIQRYFSKYQRGFWRLYFEPYRILQGFFIKGLSNSVVLTNSRFSASVIRKNMECEAEVVYPPVDVGNFYPGRKRNQIVSVGRYTPEKNYETLIRAMEKVEDAKCTIVGGRSGKVSGPYIAKLKNLIHDLKLEDRVTLLVGIPFRQLKQILATSKIYVHPMIYEHFGISVVEAMASGCVPIVHRSGGPYMDIVDHDKYGFSFEDVEGLTEKINLILCNDELRREYGRKALEQSKEFNRLRFKEKIMEVLEQKQ